MSTTAPTSLPWRRHAITVSGISLEVVDGPLVLEGDAADFHYISQAHGQVGLDVWLGKTITLAWWRGRFGARNAAIDSETAVAVCGRPALRQEARVPEQRATGAVLTDGGIGHLESTTPAEVHVAIEAAAADGTPFVVSWRIEASRREALRGDEARFFASIRCAP